MFLYLHRLDGSSAAEASLKKIVRTRSKAAKALKTLVGPSSVTTFLEKSVSSQLEFRMRVKLLLERVVRM